MKRDNVEYQILSPEEYQRGLERKYFACRGAKSRFEAIRIQIDYSRH